MSNEAPHTPYPMLLSDPSKPHEVPGTPYYLTGQQTGKIKAQKNPGISAGAVGVASCDSLAIGNFLASVVGFNFLRPCEEEFGKIKTVCLGDHFQQLKLCFQRRRLFLGDE